MRQGEVGCNGKQLESGQTDLPKVLVLSSGIRINIHKVVINIELLT